MLTLIAENWWLYILRGFLTIAFGIVALTWPNLTLRVLIILFGVYAILQGILATGAAFRRWRERSWWLVLLEGVAGIAVGLVAFIWPTLTAIILLVLIALWAIATGIIEIAAAVQLRKELAGEWRLALAGAISIFTGILFLSDPGAGAVALVWLIGIYAVLFGALLTYIGFALRKHESL
jgi:uncharacterized membrane protein HdeD (DUF308 family)